VSTPARFPPCAACSCLRGNDRGGGGRGSRPAPEAQTHSVHRPGVNERAGIDTPAHTFCTHHVVHSVLSPRVAYGPPPLPASSLHRTQLPIGCEAQVQINSYYICSAPRAPRRCPLVWPTGRICPHLRPPPLPRPCP